MKAIAFDETGNTGGDLMNPDQPVFCLASVDVTEDEVTETEALFSRLRTSEWKFAKIRRNASQLGLVEKLLSATWVTPERVKIYFFHKRFMALTKLVDLIHEPSARANGVDLYERGGALAMANLLTTTLPVYLGETRVDRFVSLFVRLLRQRDEPSLALFRREALAALQYLDRKYPDTLADLFAPIVMACDNPDSWLRFVSDTELDPLIPAYYSLADAWGKTLGERYLVLADASKTLAKERELLLKFAANDLREVRIGSPTRNIELPLKVADIVTTDSRDSRAVQLADLFAGAVSYGATPLARRIKPDALAKNFFNLIGEHCWADGIWPSHNITPEQLGMEDYVGENPVDYSTRVLKGDPTTRK